MIKTILSYKWSVPNIHLVDINKEDDSNFTALDLAISNNHLIVVQYLLQIPGINQ